MTEHWLAIANKGKFMILEITGRINGKNKQLTGELIEVSNDPRLEVLKTLTLSRTGRDYITTWYKSKVWQLGSLIMHLLNVPIQIGYEVDHIDRDLTNYKTDNLRSVTHSINNQNKGKSIRCKSKHKSIHWCNTRQKYIAKIYKNGIQVWRESFDDEEKALIARKRVFARVFPGMEYVD